MGKCAAIARFDSNRNILIIPPPNRSPLSKARRNQERRRRGRGREKKEQEGKLDRRESNILLKSWNKGNNETTKGEKEGGGKGGKKKKGGKRLFEPGCYTNILFSPFPRRHYGDIVVEMPFHPPQCPALPPPLLYAGKYVAAVSVTVLGPGTREGSLAESSCLFSSFLLLVNLFH